jgi:hypothetical protein
MFLFGNLLAVHHLKTRCYVAVNKRFLYREYITVIPLELGRIRRDGKIILNKKFWEEVIRLLAFTSTVILGSGPRGTNDHIFLSPDYD